VPDFDLLVLGDINPDLVLRGEDVEPAFGQVERLADESDLVIGGSGAIGFLASTPLALDTVATCIQCLNVFWVIGVPSTATTAFAGMPPLLPHAARPTRANKTAPSAGMSRTALNTTRAL